MPNSGVDKATNGVRCTHGTLGGRPDRLAQQELSAHLPRLSPRPQQHEGGGERRTEPLGDFLAVRTSEALTQTQPV